ncbi:MAG: hypothetical protein H7062_20910 [Candidatus Saccharimonas sp.]|nr:hypothetical protein [Planctomycetaceae bacterium]
MALPCLQLVLNSDQYGKLKFILDSSPSAAVSLVVLAGFFGWLEYKREQGRHHQQSS